MLFHSIIINYMRSVLCLSLAWKRDDKVIIIGAGPIGLLLGM